MILGGLAVTLACWDQGYTLLHHQGDPYFEKGGRDEEGGEKEGGREGGREEEEEEEEGGGREYRVRE